MKTLETIVDDLDRESLQNLTEYLLSFVTPARQARIDAMLAQRTRYLTVALENLYRMHNASAVVRSCECFGIQDLHVIESSNPFEINKRIVQGSAKWVTLNRYGGPDATPRCLDHLKEEGYRVVAMSLEPGALPIETLPLDRPLALCFGSEEPGLSDRARQTADIAATIPMHGFTQSLNLSVSAGIALRVLSERLRYSDVPWRLATEDRDRLRALWLARSVSAGQDIVRRYIESRPRGN